MSRTFRSLGVGILALCIAAAASAAPSQTQGTRSSKAAAAASHSLAGKLEKYDASANSIVVNTGKGTETLSLGSATSIRMGTSRLSAADLAAHTGAQVKVRYTEANGQRMVQMVQIEGAPRAARTQTPAKK